MFKKIFESVPIPYRLPLAEEWPEFPPAFIAYPGWYPEFITPPRIYAEEIFQLVGMFVSTTASASSERTITVLGINHCIYGAIGATALCANFNSMTGGFTGRGAWPGLFQTSYVCQTRDGSLWQMDNFANFAQIDMTTMLAIPGTQRASAEFGGPGNVVTCPLVDRLLNVLVCHSNLATANSISVFNFTTGVKIRDIPVSGLPKQIMPEDDHRCWVVTMNNILNLVNYITGEILSTLRAPVDGNSQANGSEGTLYAWDFYMKRLLVCQKVANAVDGASLSKIMGYYPVPVPVAITAPIPLKVMRTGRQTPVLCRSFGDAGEKLTGGRLGADVSGASVLTSTLQSPDVNGDTIFQVTGITEGSTTIDVSLTIP